VGPAFFCARFAGRRNGAQGKHGEWLPEERWEADRLRIAPMGFALQGYASGHAMVIAA